MADPFILDSIVSGSSSEHVGNINTLSTIPNSTILTKLLNFNRKSQTYVINEILQLNKVINEFNDLKDSTEKSAGRLKFLPYFRNKSGEAQSSFSDIPIINIQQQYERNSPFKWTDVDNKNLRIAVLKSHIQQALKSLFEKRAELLSQKTDLIEIETKIKQVENMKFEDLNMNFDEIDYDFISNYFVKQHTPIQCKLQWLNVIVPSMIHKTWTDSENQTLLIIAKKYKQRNWALITQEMNLPNTVQTFIHYQRYLNRENCPCIKCKGFKIGNRRPNKCFLEKGLTYRRIRIQQYCSFPSRFSTQEDILLIKLVEKYGANNWVQISTYFSEKSPGVLRKRFRRLKDTGYFQKKWNYDEDLTLIKLSTEHENNWKEIANHLPNRTSQECSKRYEQLLKFRKNGVWQIGVCAKLRKSYTLQEDETNINIAPRLTANDSTAVNPIHQSSDFSNFTRIWRTQVRAMKSRVSNAKKKFNEFQEKWQYVHDRLNECAWRLENNLKPDPNASNWEIRYQITKLLAELPKRTTEQVYDYLTNDSKIMNIDGDSNFKYITCDDEGLEEYESDVDITALTYKFFGILLFPSLNYQNENSSLPIKMDRIEQLLSKNEVLLQQTDLSVFKRKKTKLKKSRKRKDVDLP